MQIVTIPHTGTHFVVSLLKNHGVHCNQRHQSPEVLKGLIISPIREPIAVYRSWVARGRPLHLFKTNWEWFNTQFETSKEDMCVIPLDTENREECLENLSEKLKIPLSTNWKPVDSRPHMHKDFLVPGDMQDIYNLPVVSQFYQGV